MCVFAGHAAAADAMPAMRRSAAVVRGAQVCVWRGVKVGDEKPADAAVRSEALICKWITVQLSVPDKRNHHRICQAVNGRSATYRKHTQEPVYIPFCLLTAYSCTEQDIMYLLTSKYIRCSHTERADYF